MGALWLDIELLADREEELELLFAELVEDEGVEDELPPIIQDEVPEWDFWGEAA